MRLEVPPESEDAAAGAWLAVISLGLKALGDRTLLGLYHLLPVLGIATVMALAWKISDEPTDRQLSGLAIYGVFVLMLVWLTRRKGNA